MAIKVSQRYIDSIYKPVVINKKSNKFFEQAQGEFIQNGSKTQQELLSDNSYMKFNSGITSVDELTDKMVKLKKKRLKKSN